MRGKRERTKTVKYIWSGLLFLAVSGILTLIARISLSFSEWYSTYIYKGLVSVIGRLFGKVPFSFVELSLYVVIFLMIGTGIHAAFESRKAGRKAIWQWLAGLFLDLPQGLLVRIQGRAQILQVRILVPEAGVEEAQKNVGVLGQQHGSPLSL